MSRKGAYTCSLTPTVTQRIFDLLTFMVDHADPTERMHAARTIQTIMTNASCRRTIGPRISGQPRLKAPRTQRTTT